MKRLILALAATTGLLAALPASAQFAKPEDAIKYRKAGFTIMAAHFGRIGAMASGKAPFDAKLAAENAEIVAEVAKLPFGGFTDGSDKGDTRAKAEIWSERAKFNTGATQLQDAANKLNVAAKSGNLDAIKAAFGETAKTCKACHDSYRKE